MAAESTVQFAAEVGAARAARAWLRSLLADLDAEAAAGIELAMSELVANGVRHGAGPIALTLRRGHAQVSIGVADTGGGRPILGSPRPDQPHGRGLRIVDRVADEWWVEPDPMGGKTVWMRVRHPANVVSTRTVRVRDDRPAPPGGDTHMVALTLQRSLLPSVIRAPEGAAIAARYVPAEGELGGDWYDVFELPDRRLALVIGDVVGHGLDAAIIMGRLRSALRAYSLDYDDPAEVLARLDRKIRYFEPDALATVLLGTAPPPYHEWDFSSAGHPAPMLRLPGDQPRQLNLPVDPLLGAVPDAPRRRTRVSVPGGSLLCLFTDGLVERRPDPAEPERDVVAANLGRIARALTVAEDPEVACARILDEVVGDKPMEDDVALLALLLPGSGVRPSHLGRVGFRLFRRLGSARLGPSAELL